MYKNIYSILNLREFRDALESLKKQKKIVFDQIQQNKYKDFLLLYV